MVVDVFRLVSSPPVSSFGSTIVATSDALGRLCTMYLTLRTDFNVDEKLDSGSTISDSETWTAAATSDLDSMFFFFHFSYVV
mmetsp:Transcript_26546/g.55321  ORF Transcript_26546/g.55321 Transcript_26546/m.55321 type:complete len:82 (+) Transcript_26546:162-407(+)